MPTEFCPNCDKMVDHYDRLIQECGRCGHSFAIEEPYERPKNPDREIYVE